MSEPALHAHATREEMAATLAGVVADTLGAAIGARGHAGLVLSGGSTPAALYERLAAIDLPWASVTVTLADERLVPPDHPASNEGFVRRLLLRDRAAAARFTGLWSAQDAEISAERRLADFPWPADMVILGMGTDGHTASLFPGAAALAGALAGDCRVMRIDPEPLPADAPFPRLSLTLSALLDSRRILLLLAGTEKRRVFGEACAGDEVQAMPVRAVLFQDRVPVETHWAP